MTKRVEPMDELFIRGIDDTIQIAKALIANGYRVIIQEFAREKRMDDIDWFDIITYSILYVVMTDDEKV